MQRDSERTPGYSFRRAGANRMEEQSRDTVHKMDVHGDNSTTVPLSEPTPEEAERAATRKKTFLK